MLYRGININPGANGELVFESLPRTEHGHWCRFVTLDEINRLLPGSGALPNERDQIIRTVIDRMVADAPVETGSIRAEPLLTIHRTVKQLFRWIGG